MRCCITQIWHKEAVSLLTDVKEALQAHAWLVCEILLFLVRWLSRPIKLERFVGFFADAIQPAYKITLVKVEDNKPAHFS